MTIGRPRRYYLLKRLAANRRRDGVMASVWQAKQEGEPGASLAEAFPYRSRLGAVGYLAIEDLGGATVEALQQSGFTQREAAAILAAAVTAATPDPPAPLPVLASLDFGLADTDGGDAITITGTDLGSVLSCTVGGTSATVTSNTTTSLTFTMPAKASGLHDVQVTTANGASNTLAIEAWSPFDDADCTIGFESPDYDGGTGTWTPRIGSQPLVPETGNFPPETAGRPVYNGTNQSLRDQAVSALNTYLTANAGTIATVCKPTAAATAQPVTPYNMGPIVTNNGQGTIGLWYGDFSGTNKLAFHIFDGSYKVAEVTASISNDHAAVATYEGSGGIGTVWLSVDGSTLGAGIATIGPWAFETGTFVSGRNWNGGVYFAGELKALLLFDTTKDQTFADKFYQWSRSRHGVA